MSEFFSGSLDAFWPHAILLSVAIAASFSVAAGIVLENPKWSVANVLVVGGVAIEGICTLLLFRFDEGISDVQQKTISEQEGKLIALTERLLPYSLDNAQCAKLQTSIRQFPNTSFDLAVTNIKSALFAVPLRDCLKNASWLPQPWTGGGDSNWAFTDPPEPIGMIALLGIGVRTSDGLLVAAMFAIADGLRQAGIADVRTVFVPNPDGQNSRKVIDIMIGEKR